MIKYIKCLIQNKKHNYKLQYSELVDVGRNKIWVYKCKDCGHIKYKFAN
jgi:uncharacterized OB-fold protein